MKISKMLVVGAMGLSMVAQAAEIEEIFVTARIKEESLQSTPVSVLAFGANALEDQNVDDLTDISRLAPNVNIGAGGGLGSNNGSFSVRGLGANRNAVNQESAVALYIDDFYYGRSDGALLGVIDIANVQISRGPQGTLFGRNATAGAIQYVTQKPEFGEQSGSISLDLGSDNKRNLIVSGNLPVGDNTAVRLTAATMNQDGFVTNAIGQELGEVGTDVLRAYIRTEVSDSLEVLAQLDFSQTDTVGSASQALTKDPATLRIVGTDSGSFYRSTSTLPAVYDADSFGAGLSFRWSLDSGVGVKWTSGYRELGINDLSFDFDGRASFTGFDTSMVDRSTTLYSSELQLSGDSDFTDWIGGVYYYNEQSDDARIQGSSWRIVNDHSLSSYALFGQSTFNLSDQLGLTLGLRYTKDSKDISVSETASTVRTDYREFPAASGITEVTATDSWGAMSGLIALEYQVNSDLFLFGSYSRGFRAGGLNDRPRIASGAANNWGVTSFNEEVVNAYEVGMRSEWWDSQLRLNATYYYLDMSDLQFAVTLPGSTVTAVNNAAEATSEGIEVEVTYLATDNLTLDLALGTMDAKVTKDAPLAGLVEGDTLTMAPDLKYSFSASYDIELDSGDLSLSGNYSYIDDHHSGIGAAAVIIIDSYSLVGANIRYTPRDGNWSASLYGSNLSDEEYYSFATQAGPSANGVPARGREIGLKLKYEF